MQRPILEIVFVAFFLIITFWQILNEWYCIVMYWTLVVCCSSKTNKKYRPPWLRIVLSSSPNVNDQLVNVQICAVGREKFFRWSSFLQYYKTDWTRTVRPSQKAHWPPMLNIRSERADRRVCLRVWGRSDPHHTVVSQSNDYCSTSSIHSLHLLSSLQWSESKRLTPMMNNPL